jgi:hypothetical protein
MPTDGGFPRSLADGKIAEITACAENPAGLLPQPISWTLCSVKSERYGAVISIIVEDSKAVVRCCRGDDEVHR